MVEICFGMSNKIKDKFTILSMVRVRKAKGYFAIYLRRVNNSLMALIRSDLCFQVTTGRWDGSDGE